MANTKYPTQNLTSLKCSERFSRPFLVNFDPNVVVWALWVILDLQLRSYVQELCFSFSELGPINVLQ